MKLIPILAETGIEVINAFKKHRQDIKLILMDCRMPEMDGYEATRCIRDIQKNESLLATPIIALTANVIKEDIERCYTSGMDDYLTKPIHRQKLERTIARWLLGQKAFLTDDAPSPSSTEAKTHHLIDIDIFNEMRDVMGDDFQVMLHHYLGSIPTYFETMNNAVSDLDFESIAGAAHPLKSSSASLGATQLKEMCADIEARAHNKIDINDIQRHIADAHHIALNTIKTMKDMMNDTSFN